MHAQPVDRPRVLVVDDHADTVEVTALLLEQFGAVVDAAYNGHMAIERARSANPDLILVDLSMPEVDGYHVAQTLHNPPFPPIRPLSRYRGGAGSSTSSGPSRLASTCTLPSPLTRPSLSNWWTPAGMPTG